MQPTYLSRMIRPLAPQIQRFWTNLLALIITVLVLSPRLEAQADSTDLHQYFDDGGLSKRKTVLSTNFLAPVSGIAALRIERAFSKGFSLEIGVYKALPFYLYELILPISAYFDDFTPKSGWGFSVAPHFFFWKEAPEYHWFGPRFGWRYHQMADGSRMDVKDFTLDYGYNLFLSKHFMFCYDIGPGIRWMAFHHPAMGSSLPFVESRGTLYMYWSLGLGVIF